MPAKSNQCHAGECPASKGAQSGIVGGGGRTGARLFLRPIGASDVPLAMQAILCASTLLEVIARQTDDPVPGLVEAADWLDMAFLALEARGAGWADEAP